MTPALRGHLAMLCFSGLVAGSFALGSMAAQHIEPAALNAPRFVLAAVIVGAGAMLSCGIPRETWRAPWRYLALGGAMGLYFVLMFEGLKTAPPVSAAAVFTLTPILSGIAGNLMLRQITTPRMAMAFEVGRGEMIYFWGCAAHAIYTPLVRRLNRGERPVVFSFGTVLGAAVLVTATGWSDIRATDWASMPAIVWITILYTAVFATAATFILLQYASLNLPSAKVMAYTYLVPTWVAVWQVALGHALPPVMVLTGVALTVAALVLLLKDEHPPVR